MILGIVMSIFLRACLPLVTSSPYYTTPLELSICFLNLNDCYIMIAEVTTMTFKMANYGQERDLNCTDEEREAFGFVVQILEEAGLDTSMVRLMRKSDDYVSAVMTSSSDYGDMDIARIKFTPRAKWIKTGPGFEKTKLAHPSDVQNLSEKILTTYHFNEPYL